MTGAVQACSASRFSTLMMERSSWVFASTNKIVNKKVWMLISSTSIIAKHPGRYKYEPDVASLIAENAIDHLKNILPRHGEEVQTVINHVADFAKRTWSDNLIYYIQLDTKQKK